MYVYMTRDQPATSMLQMQQIGDDGRQVWVWWAYTGPLGSLGSAGPCSPSAGYIHGLCLYAYTLAMSDVTSCTSSPSPLPYVPRWNAMGYDQLGMQCKRSKELRLLREALVPKSKKQKSPLHLPCFFPPSVYEWT